MSVETGDEELDRQLLRESLERNVRRFERIADRTLQECQGNDRPLNDSNGQEVSPSSIRWAISTKEWVVRMMGELRSRWSAR